MYLELIVIVDVSVVILGRYESPVVLESWRSFIISGASALVESYEHTFPDVLKQDFSIFVISYPRTRDS